MVAVVVGTEGVVGCCAVVVAAPGTHCEYQSLTLVHVYPETQVVAPVHPLPPH